MSSPTQNSNASQQDSQKQNARGDENGENESMKLAEGKQHHTFHRSNGAPQQLQKSTVLNPTTESEKNVTVSGKTQGQIRMSKRRGVNTLSEPRPSLEDTHAIPNLESGDITVTQADNQSTRIPGDFGRAQLPLLPQSSGSVEVDRTIPNDNTGGRAEQPSRLPSGLYSPQIRPSPTGLSETRVVQAQQMLINNGINPASLTQSQFTTFSYQPPAVQAKSIASFHAYQQSQRNQDA